MIAHLYGPVEEKRHDSTMPDLPGLSQELQLHSHNQCDNYSWTYGNPTYPLRRLLQAPFQESVLIYHEKADNTSMSSVKVSVEWIFGDITTQVRFNDFNDSMTLSLV